MEQMSTLDASFLEFEDAVSHMHIGSVGDIRGTASPPEELRGMVLRKLSLVPRYRQVVRFVAVRHGPARMGRRPAFQPRLPPAPHGAACRRGETRSCATWSGA